MKSDSFFDIENVERIINDANILTENEKELVRTFWNNLCSRGMIWSDDDAVISVTEMILLTYHHRKAVYEEVSDYIMNKSMNFEKIDNKEYIKSLQGDPKTVLQSATNVRE